MHFLCHVLDGTIEGTIQNRIPKGQGTSKVSASAVAALTSASKGSGRPAVRKNPMGKLENPRVFGTEHLQKEWKISRKTDLNVDVGKKTWNDSDDVDDVNDVVVLFKDNYRWL